MTKKPVGAFSVHRFKNQGNVTLPTLKTKQILLFAMVICLLADFSLSYAQKPGAGITFEENRITADINGITLKEVLEEFKSAKGISYKGVPALLQVKIAINFQETSLAKALQRILSGFDHCLIYNGEEVIHVRIVAKSARENEFIKRKERSNVETFEPYTEKPSPSYSPPPTTNSDDFHPGKNISTQARNFSPGVDTHITSQHGPGM